MSMKTNKSAKSGNQSGGNPKVSRPRNPPPNKRNAKNSKSTGAQPQKGVAAAYSSQQVGRAPVMLQSKDSIRIVHRELVGNLSGPASAAFTSLFQLPLNPGMPTTFQWLSTIAQNWETYRFNKLKFCYYTRTGSTTVGSVIMAPDYDAADGPPPTEPIMSSYEDVVEDVPWKDISCLLRPSAMHNSGPRKYLRNQALAANLDIKTYDAGNMFVFAVDSAGAAAWGKLWVEYDVTLFTPQSQTGLPVGLAGASFVNVAGATAAQPFGTTVNSGAGNSGIDYDTATGTFTFQKTGNYLLGGNLTGTVLTAFDTSVHTGLTVISNTEQPSGAGTDMTFYAAFNVTSPGATYVPSVTATTVTNAGTYINIASAPLSSLY